MQRHMSVIHDLSMQHYLRMIFVTLTTVLIWGMAENSWAACCCNSNDLYDCKNLPGFYCNEDPYTIPSNDDSICVSNPDNDSLTFNSREPANTKVCCKALTIYYSKKEYIKRDGNCSVGEEQVKDISLCDNGETNARGGQVQGYASNEQQDKEDPPKQICCFDQNGPYYWSTGSCIKQDSYEVSGDNCKRRDEIANYQPEAVAKNQQKEQPTKQEAPPQPQQSSDTTEEPAKVSEINADVISCRKQLSDDYQIKILGLSTEKDEVNSSKKTTIQYEYRGSDAFKKCQTMTKEKWGDLVAITSPEQIVDSFYKQGWKEAKDEVMRLIGARLDAVKDASQKCAAKKISKCKGIESCGNQNSCCQEEHNKLSSALKSLAQQISNSQTELQSLAIELDKCIGTVPAMDYVKYDDKNLITGNAPNMGVLEAKTSDGKIQCSTTGVEVQDYPACKDIVNAYDGAIVGETVMGVVQTYQTNQTVSDNFYDFNQDPTNPTAALQAQLNSTKNERVISDTRAGFYTAKMAAMAGLISSIPNYDDLLKKCEDRFGNSFQSKIAKEARPTGNDSFVGQLQNKLDEIMQAGNFRLSSNETVYNKHGNDRDAGFCGNAIYQTSFNLIQNQRAKDAAIEAAVQAGVDMTKYGLSSYLLRDQEDRIKKAIRDVDDYMPKDYEVKLKDEKVKYCQKHPNADGCRYTARNPYESSLADNTISLSASGATETGLGVDNDDGTYGASNIAPGTQSVNPMGDAVIASNPSADYESPPPPPGQLQAVNGGGSGAGGGGGGSAGGVPSGDNNKGSSNPGGYYKPQSVNYSNAGASVGYTGGKVSSKKETAKNPLEGLLNKPGSEDNSNTISTFRNPASLSKKEDDLFQKITSRYESVVKQKRLMEYNIVDKKAKKKSKPSPRP